MEEEGLPAIYYPFHRRDFRSSRSLPVPDQGSVWPNKKVAERFDAEIEEDWEGFSVWVREVLIHGNGFNGDQHMFKDSLIGGSILSATLGKFSREGSSRQRDNATSPQTLSTLNRQVGACFAEEELMIYGLSRFSPSQVFVTTLLFPNRHFMWRRCDICVWFWGDREAPLRLVCFPNWGLALLGLSTMIVRGALSFFLSRVRWCRRGFSGSWGSSGDWALAKRTTKESPCIKEAVASRSFDWRGFWGYDSWGLVCSELFFELIFPEARGYVGDESAHELLYCQTTSHITLQ